MINEQQHSTAIICGDDEENSQQQQQQQQKNSNNIMFPCQLYSAVVALLVVLLIFGTTSTINPTMFTSQQQQEILFRDRWLQQEQQPQTNHSQLIARDPYYEQFYEYSLDPHKFSVHRTDEGHLYALLIIDGDDHVGAHRVDCYEVTTTIAKCNNTEFHFILDIFTFSDSNTTETGYPTILYTDIDGHVHSVIDDADDDYGTNDENVDGEDPVLVTSPTSDESNPSNYNDDNDSSAEPSNYVSDKGDWIDTVRDWSVSPDGRMNNSAIACLVGLSCIVFLSILTMLFRRQRRYRAHKRMMDEIHMEGTIRHCNSSSSTYPSKTRSVCTGNRTGDPNSDESDHTELYEFSDSDDYDPSELREVDLL